MLQDLLCTDGIPDCSEDVAGHVDDLNALLATNGDLDFGPLALEPAVTDQTVDRSLQTGPGLHQQAGSLHPVLRHGKDERRQELAREAQRRFRRRAAARKEAIEADLAATKAELKALQLREQRLAARNALLEKVATLNKTDAATPAQVASCTVIASKVVSGGPVLTVHLWDQKQELDLQAVSRMSAVEFTQLWTGYMHELGNLLLQHNTTGMDVQHQLVPVLLEAASLFCCLMAYNVTTLKALTTSRMDNGQALETHQRGPALYTDYLAVANLSKEQVHDLLYLRRMCIVRRCQLAHDCQAMLARMPAECFSGMQMPVPTDNVIRLHSIGAFIRDNGSEDYRMWCATRCACMHGVLTGTQHAMAQVHAYPSLLSIDNFLDCIAAQHQEPSRQELLKSADHIDTRDFVVDLDTYVGKLNEDDCHVYKPFPQASKQLCGIETPGDEHSFVQYTDVF